MEENEIRFLFGKNLKRLRKMKNLSQMEFSNKVEMAFTFISDIENGKKWVSPETLSKFSKALEVEVYQFFLPENYIQPPEKTIENFAKEIEESLQTITQRHLVF